MSDMIDHTENSVDIKIDIKCTNDSNNPNPQYETKGASGFDIRAFIPEPITLKPLQRAIIKTGLYFELPDSYEMQIRPRSGLAAKFGITVLNSPGTIDCDYRGEVGIILINLSEDNFTVESGDRIAQGVIQTSLGGGFYRFIDSTKLSDSVRGESGFGSTGIK